MKVSLTLALLLGGGALAAGLAAYEEGRWDEAAAVFAAAAAEAGADASAELLDAWALAAARRGDWLVVEDAGRRAASRGGEPFVARRSFLRGNAAFSRAEAAAQAARVGAGGLAAWDKAVVLTEAARLAWVEAASSRADWPEARRNVARAQRALEGLRAEREAARAAAGEKPSGDPPPAPDRPPTPPPELSEEQKKDLLERLARMEQRKVEQRRKRPATQGVRDW